MHGRCVVRPSLRSRWHRKYSRSKCSHSKCSHSKYVTVLREEEQLVGLHRREAVPARAGGVGRVLGEARRPRLLLLLLRRDTYATTCAVCAAASAASAATASAAPAPAASATSASAVVCGVQRQRCTPHLHPAVHCMVHYVAA